MSLMKPTGRQAAAWLMPSLLALVVASGCGLRPMLTPKALPPLPARTEAVSGGDAQMAKIDSNLRSLVSDFVAGKDVRSAAREAGWNLTDANQILVDVYVNGPVAQAEAPLKALGMQVLAENESVHVVEGLLPLERVFDAARLEVTRAVIPVAPAH